MGEIADKRAWNSFQAGFGKRAWNHFNAGYGKRAWNHFNAGYGKRGWNSQFAGAYGKRSLEENVSDHFPEKPNLHFRGRDDFCVLFPNWAFNSLNA